MNSRAKPLIAFRVVGMWNDQADDTYCTYVWAKTEKGAMRQCIREMDRADHAQSCKGNNTIESCEPLRQFIGGLRLTAKCANDFIKQGPK